MLESKRQLISETYKATKERRSLMIPLSFEFKIKNSHCNNAQKTHLKMCFVEAKWLRNYLLEQMKNPNFDIFKVNYKDFKIITHKDKDGNDIEVLLQHLSAAMIQTVIKEIQINIKQLSHLKKNGNKIGGLKFESEHKSILLKQYGATHELTSHKRLRIQGCRKPYPVSGDKQLKQLDKAGLNYEITSATLSHIDDMYFVHITVWVNKKDYYAWKDSKKHIINDKVGIDFGCQTAFTLSNGDKINAFFEESYRIKKIQRKISKSKKGSKNRYRLRKLLHKAWYRHTCLKKEAANQLVSWLLKSFNTIIIQDEQIKSWSKKHGKKVQHSILGLVKSKLIGKPNVHVWNKWVPTTKLCTECGTLNKNIKLWDRQFVCPECGTSMDRDIHAALNMVWLYENDIKIGLDGSEFKRAEFMAAVKDAVMNISTRELNHEC